MATNPDSEHDDREHAADAAAARGDLAGARALLEQIVALRPKHIDAWLKLAGARRAAGDLEGAIDAANRALTVDPLHVLALLTRGRILEGAGRPRQAARDYIYALAQNGADHAALPPQLQPLVAHARTMAERYRDWTAAQWDTAIADLSLNRDRRERIERFKTNALRRTRVYHSEPTHYHYPGLIEREFHERDDFSWSTRFEAATDAIRAEMAALVASDTAVSEPYVQYENEPLRQWAALNHSLDWTAFHLLKGGKTIEDNARRCPATMAALSCLPQPRLVGRGPNAMFSLLKPRTRIPPHNGVSNTRLVCHLPLVVPPDCWFRVGAETRAWREGELVIFDDTIEHEAANDGDQPRVVLIFDIWHPGLDEAERSAVTRLMDMDEEIDGATL